VKNERRQRIENRPMGLVERVELEALYPPEHPYHHEVIGSMADLSAASAEEVKAFFRTYYVPGNATLTIAGDVDRARAKDLVAKYFGPIPPGAPVTRRAGGEVRLTAPKRIAMEAKIQQPQLYVDYPSPANFAPGDRELDVLANVLGNGKASRLYKRLVYDLKIAQAVTAQQQSQLLSSTFEITASPMPGHTVDEILAVIDEETAKLQGALVEPAELDRAKNQIESEGVRSLEPVLARAERLQSYNYLLGDPGFVTEDLRRYRAVDAAAVQRYAREVLDRNNRVIVTVDPNPDAPIMGRVKK
jgi:zinc protease